MLEHKWIRHFGGLLDMGDDSGNKLLAARSEVGGSCGAVSYQEASVCCGKTNVS